MKLFLSLFITICAILGIFDAGYVTYTEVSGIIPPCKPPFSCQEVLDSPWSKIGPVPVSALGLLFYSTVLVLGMLSVLEKKSLSVAKTTFEIPTLLVILGVSGLLFSGWLIFVMSVLLHAWCVYCILSAVNCFIIFLLTTSLFVMKRKEEHALHV